MDRVRRFINHHFYSQVLYYIVLHKRGYETQSFDQTTSTSVLIPAIKIKIREYNPVYATEAMQIVVNITDTHTHYNLHSLSLTRTFRGQ